MTQPVPDHGIAPFPLPRPIDVRPILWPRPFDPVVIRFLRECTPRILVVTDGLRFGAASGFGLSQFVNTVKTTSIHGMLPSVITASRGTDPDADLQNFTFDSTVTTAKYDVVFLFGIGTASAGVPGQMGNLPKAEVDVLARFMQAGGGLFATGDHEDLGAALSGNLPRVRGMRHWYFPPAPPVGSSKRITTNAPGQNGVFEFEDQSDAVPQRTFPRYYASSASPAVSAPHALLQAPPVPGTSALYQPIEFLPDHPHEGECVVPANLEGTFDLGGTPVEEWPREAGSPARLAPEVIAFGVTYGGAFPGKSAIPDPRAFGVVGAYDGHRAGVGRAAVDSTWHHFVNINIDGTGSARSGLQEPDPANPGQLRDTQELLLIRRYWTNLASWLMPAKVRKCSIFGWLLQLAGGSRLVEDLQGWANPARRKDFRALQDLGGAATALMSVGSTPAEVSEALDDLTDLAFGGDARRHLSGTPGDELAGCLEASAAGEFQRSLVAASLVALHDLTTPGKGVVEAIEARGGLHALPELIAAPAREGGARALVDLRRRAREAEKAMAGLEKLHRR
ncbi:MAG TPA: hypothetical protein VF530_06275 [Planctomycetota bacterium]